jgi:N-acetylglucosaminyldiphosphoundecaprenol N-acetyl-beta-D-mannosaminyltransferase
MYAGVLTTFRRVNLFGTEVCALNMDEVLSVCESCVCNKTPLLLGVVNVAKLVNCRKNTVLRESLGQADIILADGLPIVWLSKLIGDPLPERVAGIDIMYNLLEKACARNYSVYFLGAKPEVVKKAVEVIKASYPGLRLAGYRDGYFDEFEERGIAEQIKKSSADILFVAMSSPKKEIFLRKWRDYMNVSVCHGVGGSFDVVAGITKRAPFWMQKCGMEWFYRLIQEPRKMWRRYLTTNAVFIKMALEAIVRANFSGTAGESGIGTTSSDRREE